MTAILSSSAAQILKDPRKQEGLSAVCSGFFVLFCFFLGETQTCSLHSSQIRALVPAPCKLRMFCAAPRLAGSYQALDGGCAAEALVDFTGAVAESINLEEGKYGEVISEQMKLFEDLMKVHKRGGFISCSISVSTERWILRVYFNENILEEIPLLGY